MSLQRGGSYYSPAVDDKLSRQVERLYTSTDLAVSPHTLRQVLHRRVRGNFSGGVSCDVRREERRELCGQLIQARAAIMIVTSEFPWRRAARESHSPTVSPM